MQILPVAVNRALSVLLCLITPRFQLLLSTPAFNSCVQLLRSTPAFTAEKVEKTSAGFKFSHRNCSQKLQDPPLARLGLLIEKSQGADSTGSC